MTVYIAHAKADAAAADSLKKVLEMRGLRAETEDGSRGYRALTAQDSVVALWSKDALFDHTRLMFEKRALDAWADGGLVLVKLDRQFAPVGLRDLPAVDASFEQQRDLVAWPEVAKRIAAAASAKVSGALNSKYGQPLDAMRGGAPGGRSSGGPGEGRARSVTIEEEKGAADDGEAAPKQPPAAAKRSGGGGFGVVFGLLVAVAAGGLLAAMRLAPGLGLDRYGREIGLQPTQQLMALAALAIFGVLLALFAATRRSEPAKAGKAAEAREEAPAPPTARPAPAPGRAPDLAPDLADEPIPPDAVFISYARADGPFVMPVCEQLKRDGRHVWLDQDGIDAGDSWAGEIVRAIRTVRGVAVMCSKAAFESDHVKREVYLADRYKKRLLPVLIDDTPMPDDFEYFFAGVQWLKLHETPEKDRAVAMAKALGLGEPVTA